MRKLAIWIVAVALISTSSCVNHKDEAPLPVIKVGLVGGIGGFSDRGFNQNILAGFQQAAKDFTLDCQARECFTKENMTDGINYFLANKYDLIITAGFDASESTIKAAKTNPGVNFIIIDYSMPNPPANLLCAVFDIDQSAFTCGFLAAYWAHRTSIQNPVAGFVAGPEIPEIRQFSVSYTKGIGYFNTKYQKNIESLGYYANSFNDTLQGAMLADSLIGENASVIFAFAGKTGNGSLYKAYEKGIHAIGVDVDQYISIPQVGPVLLTSCMKGLYVMVYDILHGYAGHTFPGGSIMHGNLGNGGVRLAPFHDYEQVIPDSIKTAIAGIETGIKNGTISTGWPE